MTANAGLTKDLRQHDGRWLKHRPLHPQLTYAVWLLGLLKSFSNHRPMHSGARDNRRAMTTTAGVALAIALLCSLPMLGRGQCQLQLAVSNSSTINFAGTSTQPLRQPITLQGSPALSLAGNISLQLPGACPGSTSSLLSDLQSAQIQAQSGQQLALLPNNLTAQVRTTPGMVAHTHFRGLCLIHKAQCGAEDDDGCGITGQRRTGNASNLGRLPKCQQQPSGFGWRQQTGLCRAHWWLCHSAKCIGRWRPCVSGRSCSKLHNKRDSHTPGAFNSALVSTCTCETSSRFNYQGSCH